MFEERTNRSAGLPKLRAMTSVTGPRLLALTLSAIAMLGASQAAAQVSKRVSALDDLLNPLPGQFQVQIENMSGFTGPGSIVRVREFEREGTGLHFSDLGMDTEQMPTADLRYWFNELNAVHFRFRYFDVGGSHFFSAPVNFNGATIAGGQVIHADPSQWFMLGLYYERRLTPLFEAYETGWPAALRGWDVRGRIGIEYTYINFSLNGGHARVTSTSHGEETKEDFNHQAMPLPTIGLEALHRLGENFVFKASVEGNWINRWNSLRNEGGTVWASQNGIEAHLRLFYANPAWLGPVRPMLGFFVYTYSQLEDSHEDGNFIRWSSFGPEVGIGYSF